MVIGQVGLQPTKTRAELAVRLVDGLIFETKILLVISILSKKFLISLLLTLLHCILYGIRRPHAARSTRDNFWASDLVRAQILFRETNGTEGQLTHGYYIYNNIWLLGKYWYNYNL